MAEYTKDICLAPDSEPVCYCFQVTKADILNAKKYGAKSLSDIKNMTGACQVDQCKTGLCKVMNPRGR
ncbi:MAG: (2Fe-2S)-binding protein [Desulfatibacillum sp.]|nr:(2Fe-2S)-binding protein [Desulfatibacillum sp.]